MSAETASLPRTRQRVASMTRQERQQATQATRRPLLARIFRRQEVTTFHRFLAVHMHFAERRGFFH
jgi:hypothetical protein